MVELADAPDSKSGDGDIVRVQVPPSAPTTEGSPLRQKYEAVLLPHIFCFLARFLPCAKAGSSEIVTLTRLDILCQAVPFRRSLFRRFAPYKSRLRHQKPELTCSSFTHYDFEQCIGFVIKLPLSSLVVIAPFRNKDRHALSRSRQQDAICVFQI